jgi:diguanylate cyclase (GGDEF)-like protein
VSGATEFSHEDGTWSDRAASEADQTLSDADQTASDSDQTASDSDQSGSDGDQAAAHSDQVLSDRDQEAADLELRANPSSDPARLRAYEEAQTKRGEGTLARAAASTTRARIAGERDTQAVRRDENARRRDKTAAARDVAAARAERKAATLAGSLHDLDERTEAAFAAAAVARKKATTARVKAATDRRHAARDREAAALDREHLQDELRRSQLDDLTGAFRRGIGEVLVAGEIERARRQNDSLHLAFIDVDDMKGTNDTIGHAAGDSALRSVRAGFQVRLRPYDPIIRWGGDEFVCVIPATGAEDALGRIAGARADLARLDPRVSVSFGISSLQDGDTVTTLVARADRALIEARRSDRPADEAD